MVPTGQEELSLGLHSQFSGHTWPAGCRQAERKVVSRRSVCLPFSHFHHLFSPYQYIIIPVKENDVFHSNPRLDLESKKKIVKVLCKHESTLQN